MTQEADRRARSVDPMPESTRQILNGVLQRTGLDAPSANRPLWSYDVTSNDLASIQATLSTHDRVPASLSLYDQAALVLFAAYELCDQEHSRWEWRPLFDRLSWPQELGERFYDHLAQGLQRYWRRPVLIINGTRRYLGTIFVEGGLPTTWIRGEHRVGATIRRLIRLSERFQIPADRLVMDQMEGLASGLGREDMPAVCARFADGLVELRRRLPIGVEKPSAYLDQHDEGWRQRLPVRSGNVADEIVDELLSVVASTKSGQPPIELEVTLCGSRLQRHIRLAHRVKNDALLAELGLTVDGLPPVLYLDLESESGKRVPVARAESRGQEWVLVPRSSDTSVRGRGELRVVLTAAGRQVGSFVPEGGEELDAAAPWVFSDPDNKQRVLFAVGSAKTSQRSVIVLLPAYCAAPSPAAPGSTVERIEGPSVDGRLVYRVAGHVQCNMEGEVHDIEASPGTKERSFRLRFRGARFIAAAGRGSPPLVGLPTVLLSDGEQTLPASVDNLQWRPASVAGRWLDWRAAEPCGEVVVRYQREEAKARGRVVVLPKDLRVRPSVNNSIELVSGALQTVTTEDDGFSIEKAPPTFRLVPGNHEPRADVNLSLQFRTGGLARLAVAVPGGAGGFIGPRGEWLKPQTAIGLDRLDAVRARTVGRHQQHLEVRSDHSGWSRAATIAPSEDRGWADVRLEDLRPQMEARLFASGSLDDRLRLRFESRGTGRQHSDLYVSHYGLRAWEDRETPLGEEASIIRIEGTFGVKNRLYDADVLSASAIALAHPGRVDAVRPLEPSGSGCWLLPRDQLAYGPHLIVVHERRAVRARPFVVSTGAPKPEQTTGCLRAAAAETFEERREAWLEWLRSLASNPLHDEWPHVKTLRDWAAWIPAPAFEVFLAARDLPEFLAMWLLIQPTREDQRAVVRVGEQLGVIWQATPLKAWGRCIRRLHDAVLNANRELLQVLGGTRQMALAKLAPATLGSTSPELRFLEVVQSLAELHLPDVPPASQSLIGLPITQFASLLEQEFDPLRRRQQDADWPQSSLVTAAVDVEEERRAMDAPMWCTAVIGAPKLAAMAMVEGRKLTEQESRDLAVLRAFDQEWFDWAHSVHLAKHAVSHHDHFEDMFLP